PSCTRGFSWCTPRRPVETRRARVSRRYSCSVAQRAARTGVMRVRDSSWKHLHYHGLGGMLWSFWAAQPSAFLGLTLQGNGVTIGAHQDGRLNASPAFTPVEAGGSGDSVGAGSHSCGFKSPSRPQRRSPLSSIHAGGSDLFGLWRILLGSL